MFKGGYVKDTSGFSDKDIRPKTIDTIDIETETLNVTKRAEINELSTNTIDTNQMTVNGQFSSTSTSTIDLNGNISINNQQYVLTISEFENALAQAAVTGGSSIFVAPGTFFVSSTIQVPANTDITGSGQNTTIFRPLDNMNKDIFRIIGDNISIKQLKIDGNGNNQSGNTGANFISIANTIQNITLDSLTLENGESQTDVRVLAPIFQGDSNWGAYIKLMHSANNFSLLNCNIGPNVNSNQSKSGLGMIGIDLGDRSNFNSGRVDINDILIYGCNFNLIPKVIWGGKSTSSSIFQINQLLVQNNIFTGTSNAVVDAYFYSFLLEGLADSHISNNTFKNGVGFNFNGKNITISNNVFNKSQGIYSEANNIVISNNIFDGPGGQNASISTIGFNEIITNNKFNNCSSSFATIVNTGSINKPINTFINNNTVHDSRQPFYFGNSFFDDHDLVTIHKNQMIDKRILGNISGQVDVANVSIGSFNIGGVNPNTANNSESLDNFFNELCVSDTVDLSGVVSNTSISGLFFINPTGANIGTAFSDTSDIRLTINTFRQYTGYEDEVRLTTRNNLGLHSFILPDIKPASFGHQIKFVIEDHGGSTPGDNVIISPTNTGSNKQTFTAGPSAYTSVTLDSSNEYTIFEWNTSEWDLVRTNGTIA